MRRGVRVLLPAWLAAAPVWAADPPPPPPPGWSGEAAVSYVQSTGNSDNKTLGAGTKLRYLREPWKTELRAAFIRVETNDVDSSKRSSAALRAERTLGGRLAAYGQAGYLRDVLAGIEGQTILEAGLLYHLLDGPRHLLSVSGALAYTNERRAAPSPDLGFAAGRTALVYKLKIGASSELSEEADYLASFEDGSDWRANATTSLTASVSKVFALKVSHQLAHLNSPVPGKEKTDTVVLASLVARWPAK